MATDNSQSPSDAELEDFLAERMTPEGRVSMIATLREAIARWGAPATVGEPVAWVDERAIDWLANARSGAANITTKLSKEKSFERPMPLYVGPPITEMPDLTTLTERGKEALGEGRVPLTSEQHYAIRQGHEIAGSDAYFAARPQIDSNDRRKVFQAGFERGWDARDGITSKEGGPNAGA